MKVQSRKVQLMSLIKDYRKSLKVTLRSCLHWIGAVQVWIGWIRWTVSLVPDRIVLWFTRPLWNFVATLKTNRHPFNGLFRGQPGKL